MTQYSKTTQILYRMIEHPKNLVTREYAEANPDTTEVVEVERRKVRTTQGGKELMKLRKRLGLDRKSVAEVWGRSRQRLAAIETSGNPIEITTYEEITRAILQLAQERRADVERRKRAYDRHVPKATKLIGGE